MSEPTLSLADATALLTEAYAALNRNDRDGFRAAVSSLTTQGGTVSGLRSHVSGLTTQVPWRKALSPET